MNSNNDINKYFKKPPKTAVVGKVKGVDIDKNEYQEIVLSNSNNPQSFLKN